MRALHLFCKVLYLLRFRSTKWAFFYHFDCCAEKNHWKRIMSEWFGFARCLFMQFVGDSLLFRFAQKFQIAFVHTLIHRLFIFEIYYTRKYIEQKRIHKNSNWCFNMTMKVLEVQALNREFHLELHLRTKKNNCFHVRLHRWSNKLALVYRMFAQKMKSM